MRSFDSQINMATMATRQLFLTIGKCYHDFGLNFGKRWSRHDVLDQSLYLYLHPILDLFLPPPGLVFLFLFFNIPDDKINEPLPTIVEILFLGIIYIFGIEILSFHFIINLWLFYVIFKIAELFELDYLAHCGNKFLIEFIFLSNFNMVSLR